MADQDTFKVHMAKAHNLSDRYLIALLNNDVKTTTFMRKNASKNPSELIDGLAASAMIFGLQLFGGNEEQFIQFVKEKMQKR